MWFMLLWAERRCWSMDFACKFFSLLHGFFFISVFIQHSVRCVAFDNIEPFIFPRNAISVIRLSHLVSKIEILNGNYSKGIVRGCWLSTFFSELKSEEKKRITKSSKICPFSGYLPFLVVRNHLTVNVTKIRCQVTMWAVELSLAQAQFK